MWAAKGRNATTLRGFFDLLGEQRAAQLTHVSADGAEWIHDVVTERAPQAVLCLDAFHVVAWATAALDAVRRGMWNQLRAGGHHDEAKALKGTRWALLKNPPNLTGDQRTTVATIAKANSRSTAPTCSKSNSGRSSEPSRAATGGRCWPAGWPGPTAPASSSSSSPRPSNGSCR